MNLRQLRCVSEIVRHGLNVTAASETLYTSQSGISRQILDLEDELGVAIFVRKGKRLTDLTGPGSEVVNVIERILTQETTLRSIGETYLTQDRGTLKIATTHTQARYALPRVVKAFRMHYPNVRLYIEQGTPRQAAEAVRDGRADMAVATEALDRFPDLRTLPAYSWNHFIVVLPGHPLTAAGAITLEELAKYPLITYSSDFTGRPHIDEAFRARGLEINVVLTAMDADVIKAYTEIGLGVGIIAGIAYERGRDHGLVAIDAGPLFGSSTTRLAILKGRKLPLFIRDFMRELAPELPLDALEGDKR